MNDFGGYICTACWNNIPENAPCPYCKPEVSLKEKMALRIFEMDKQISELKRERDEAREFIRRIEATGKFSLEGYKSAIFQLRLECREAMKRWEKSDER